MKHHPLALALTVVMTQAAPVARAAELALLGSVFSEKVQGEPGTNIGFRFGAGWLFTAADWLAVGPSARYEKTFEAGDASSDYHAWDLRAGPKARLYPGIGLGDSGRLYATVEGLYGRGRYASSFTKTRSTLYEGRAGLGAHFGIGQDIALSPEVSWGHDLEREEEDDAPDSRSAVTWQRTLQTQLNFGLTAFYCARPWHECARV